MLPRFVTDCLATKPYKRVALATTGNVPALSAEEMYTDDVGTPPLEPVRYAVHPSASPIVLIPDAACPAGQLVPCAANAVAVAALPVMSELTFATSVGVPAFSEIISLPFRPNPNFDLPVDAADISELEA